MIREPAHIRQLTIVVGAIHALSAVGAILAIIGSTDADNAAQIYNQSKVHDGVVILAVVWALICALAVAAWTAKRRGRSGESLLIVAILCGLPLIGVRMLYSLLAVFSHASAFSAFRPTTTSTTVDLFMAVIMEMVVTCIYLAAGLKLPKKSDENALAHNVGRSHAGAPLPMIDLEEQKAAGNSSQQH
jgi:hypothetical protein